MAVGAGQFSAARMGLMRVGLILVLLLATGLRFYRLAGQSLWADEGNSLALARAGLAEIAARTAQDIHPPFYYWLLHGWLRIFGHSEVAVRSLSAVAGVFLVAMVYRLGTRLVPREDARTGQRVGLLAAFIAAVSPFQVYYAQEARMYMLLALCGALAVWATLELVESSWDRVPVGWALLYIVSVTLGLYTHYAFPVVLVATNLAALVGLWRSRRRAKLTWRLAGWLGLQLVPLALYLPWFPVAWRQLTVWPTPSPADLRSAWAAVWRTLFLGPVDVTTSDLWLVALGIVALVGLTRLFAKVPLPKAILVFLYLGVAVGLTLALFKPAYLKFLLVASPALCILLAWGLVGGRAERGAAVAGWLGAGLVAAAAWAPLVTYFTDPAVARDDYRSLARYLEAAAWPEDAIILNAPGQQEVFGYYYAGDTPVHPLPRSRPLDPRATIAQLEEILARSGRIFALYWATDESDPAGIIEGWLNQQAFKATDAWAGNVRLVTYAAPLLANGLLPTDARLGDHVRLTGYQLVAPRPGASSADSRSSQVTSGQIVQVQLRWATDSPLNARYVVFLQALDGTNHLAGQRDAEPLTPTTAWRPGQAVLDRLGLLIEPGTPPGEYRIIVGLYDGLTGQRLPTHQGDFLELSTITVERPGTPPPVAALQFDHPADADFGSLRLLGYDRYKLGHSYDPETPLHAGDALNVVLYWQAEEPPQADYSVALQLVPADDPASPVAEGVFPAAGVDYPTSRWEPGELVRAQFDLFIPGNSPPGTYRVTVRLLDETGSAGKRVFDLAPIVVE